MGLPSARGPRYLGVAALRVNHVWESHESAALDFEPRQYVTRPETTPYPPNLAFEPKPVAAASRLGSIVYSLDGKTGLTPVESTDQLWKRQYRVYRQRQQRWRLRVASCTVESVNRSFCLQMSQEHAPILAPTVWGGTQMSMGGLRIDQAMADDICARIASGR